MPSFFPRYWPPGTPFAGTNPAFQIFNESSLIFWQKRNGENQTPYTPLRDPEFVGNWRSVISTLGIGSPAIDVPGSGSFLPVAEYNVYNRYSDPSIAPRLMDDNAFYRGLGGNSSHTQFTTINIQPNVFIDKPICPCCMCIENVGFPDPSGYPLCVNWGYEITVEGSLFMDGTYHAGLPQIDPWNSTTDPFNYRRGIPTLSCFNDFEIQRSMILRDPSHWNEFLGNGDYTILPYSQSRSDSYAIRSDHEHSMDNPYFKEEYCGPEQGTGAADPGGGTPIRYSTTPFSGGLLVSRHVITECETRLSLIRVGVGVFPGTKLFLEGVASGTGMTANFTGSDPAVQFYVDVAVSVKNECQVEYKRNLIGVRLWGLVRDSPYSSTYHEERLPDGILGNDLFYSNITRYELYIHHARIDYTGPARVDWSLDAGQYIPLGTARYVLTGEYPDKDLILRTDELESNLEDSTYWVRQGFLGNNLFFDDSWTTVNVVGATFFAPSIESSFSIREGHEYDWGTYTFNNTTYSDRTQIGDSITVKTVNAPYYDTLGLDATTMRAVPVKSEEILFGNDHKPHYFPRIPDFKQIPVSGYYSDLYYHTQSGYTDFAVTHTYQLNEFYDADTPTSVRDERRRPVVKDSLEETVNYVRERTSMLVCDPPYGEPYHQQQRAYSSLYTGFGYYGGYYGVNYYNYWFSPYLTFDRQRESFIQGFYGSG